MIDHSVTAVELPSPWREAQVIAVVPTYNEVANVPLIVDRLLALPLPNLRVMIVDDDSPDGTGAAADRLAAEHDGRVLVLHRSGKAGLGRAYVDGIGKSGYATDPDYANKLSQILNSDTLRAALNPRIATL